MGGGWRVLRILKVKVVAAMRMVAGTVGRKDAGRSARSERRIHLE
jgi:hypothetical protein